MHSNIRIIGGKWRSRNINFVSSKQEIRPSTNIVRETLFNWLAPVIENSICLDLFAGSGALGFEALSRGAKYVIMNDVSLISLQNISKNIKLLSANNIDLYQLKIPKHLSKIPYLNFNIIFLDPPFYNNLILPTINMLIELKYIKPGVFLYIETERNIIPSDIIPKTWIIKRVKISGSVISSLLIVN